ncbi:MAG TPA: type II CAAX endopeptidase family protein [Gemmataceae bacterium]|jgi:membrane protease YdiL (CAAX protease family)|nr:type II CAAX endopeptidase family protein [Gemmataceae bacterium]
MANADTGPTDDADTDPLPVMPAEWPGPLTAEPVTPRRIGRPFLAWSVICLCIGIVLWPRLSGRAEQQKDESMALITEEMQAKYLVGVSAMLGKQAGLASQAKTLNTGPLDQRLRAIVIIGELSGPAEALKELKELRGKLTQHGIQPTQTQAALLKILEKLYKDYAADRYDAPSLTPQDRELLRRELEWTGELALTPAGGKNAQARATVLRPAYRVAIVYFAVFAIGGLVALVGLAALIVFLVFLFQGKLDRGIHCGSYHGAVYAEAFALWMVLFLGFSFLVGILANKLALDANARFVAALVAECFTLVALGWPVLRGIPWSQVRWETGLTLGRRPAVEPLVGLAGNVMALPLLVLGIAVTLFLIVLQNRLHANVAAGDNFSPPDLPGHPIVKELAHGNWLEYLQVFVLACIIAPVIEETMFRGVLYRHLREATCNFGFAGSVLLSALAVSFVFAVIHPQGPIGMPPLMALAFMFSLLREWRGTLIPGMVAHGVNNGLVLLFSLTAMGN